MRSHRRGGGDGEGSAAGTTYIPGVSEEKTLAEIKRLLERHLEYPVDYLPSPAEAMTGEGADVRLGLQGAGEDQGDRRRVPGGQRFPYQEDISVEDVDLLAATPGEDINWLEDVELLEEEGVPAVFDRYSNSFIRIYFPIPEGREHEIARKVLVKHLQSGNSYGIQLKEKHRKFPQPEPWVEGSKTVGTNWKPQELEGWEPPLH